MRLFISIIVLFITSQSFCADSETIEKYIKQTGEQQNPAPTTIDKPSQDTSTNVKTNIQDIKPDTNVPTTIQEIKPDTPSNVPTNIQDIKPDTPSNVPTTTKAIKADLSSKEQQNQPSTENKPAKPDSDKKKAPTKFQELSSEYIVICAPKSVIVVTKNDSPYRAVIKDLDSKLSFNVPSKTRKEFCIPHGNHIDSLVKDENGKVIHKMPTQHLMHFTKALQMNIDEKGKIIFDIDVDTTKR